MSQPQIPVPERVWDGRARLGEGPVWVPTLGAVLFVDIHAGYLYRHDVADGGTRGWPLPEACCWLVARADGDGFLAGLRSRIVHLRLHEHGPEIVAEVAKPEPHRPGNRFNDAKADPAGRVWAATMDDAEREPTGSLYRIDDAGVTVVDTGYVVSNGPALSPDGRTLYHTDSLARTIYAFDLGADGRLSNKRVHIRVDSSEGGPDGMTCDAEGGLWVAHFGGSCLSRFLPDGRRDIRVPLPARRVTSCTFAGEALTDLYITTASLGLDDDAGAGGGLYRIRPGVRGLPAACFGTPIDNLTEGTQ
ncbi:SMP-30/gluconolactonase/LRE family protein [Arhodomonas sp. AD133]|uniref:SMP-30/gluconolactonase/LRE family protein n=1 Tax=Arhodomonas sp. AD133 TaxID=3415009 RepID=UPI003EB862DB